MNTIDKSTIDELRFTFVQDLINYLEGKETLDLLLQKNEKLYMKNPYTLPLPVVNATTTLHLLKKRLSCGEEIDTETIITMVNDLVLDIVKE